MSDESGGKPRSNFAPATSGMNGTNKLERGKSLGKEIVVFWVRRDTQCSECKKELWHGSAITLVNNNPLCLSCADLDHLVFLSRGDAALTRRAKKYSKLYAVVVQWSRTRKQYERQGLLVEEEALDKAEEECLADAEVRELRRQRAAEKRAELDAEYVESFARRIRELFPGCPSGREQRIAAHACMKYSGRVGRSTAAKALDEEAVSLAVRAHLRHAYTKYDELLMRGWDRAEARHEVQDKVNELETLWRAKAQ
jgi:hypothetical protein